MAASQLTKGIDFIDIVKALRIWLRANPGRDVPGLSPEDMAFVRNSRVLPVAWYSNDLLLRLLDVTCNLLFGGNTEGMVEMGRMAARSLYTSVHDSLIYKGDTLLSLRNVVRFTKAHFNFSLWSLEEQSKNHALVRATDYPEMSGVHGTLYIGWCAVVIELSGDELKQGRVLKGPWRGDDDYRLELLW